MTKTTSLVKKENLSEKFNTRDVAETLHGLMKRVTDKDCTAESVHAACNCARNITDLIRAHIEAERLNRIIPKRDD